MIAFNQHGQPPIAPELPSGPMLILPDFYLDLMFGDLPERPSGQILPSPAADQRETNSRSPQLGAEYRRAVSA